MTAEQVRAARSWAWVVDEATLAAYLFSRCVHEPVRGCWLWQGAKLVNGYGVISLTRLRKRGIKIAPSNARKSTTHRLAWELARGPVPKGKHVLHTCDTPNCVNPTHLFLGDQVANNLDKCAKGRQFRRYPIGTPRTLKRGPRIPTICQHCRREFQARSDLVKNGAGRTCSLSCAASVRNAQRVR